MLNEGTLLSKQLHSLKRQLTGALADGIHVDMDRLKKGEVK